MPGRGPSTLVRRVGIALRERGLARTTEPPDLNRYFAEVLQRIDGLEGRVALLESSSSARTPRYGTPRAVAEEFGIPPTTLHNWLSARGRNGLSIAVRTQGRRLYLDYQAFAQWFENNHATTNGVRR